MSVTFDADTIRLTGPCRLEDAEILASLLSGSADRAVDLAEAAALHAAVVQVLLAFRPRLAGPAGDPFTRTWLEALLQPKGTRAATGPARVR